MCGKLLFNEQLDMDLTPFGWAEPDDYNYEIDDVDPDDYNFDPECPLNDPSMYVNEYDH